MAELVPLERLKPAPWNPRLIKDERFKNLCRSIEADPELLKKRPVLAQADGTIYAGNMRYRAAQHLKYTEIWADVDDVPDQLARERALRDNGSWGEWQEDELAEILAGLQEAGADLDLLGFEHDEITRLLESAGIGGSEPLGEDEAYTRKVEPPIYEPTGPKPEVVTLYDDTKTRELTRAIEAASNLTDDERNFLKVAAQRHTVINFGRVAEYYAHADESLQTLMEDSALVIIDFDRAIELGYVKLSDQIAGLYGQDYPGI